MPDPSKSHPKFTAEQVAGAIRETRGLVTLAAQRLDCSPDTVRNYAKRYVSVAQALRDEREKMTDLAELSLYNAIQNRDAWAVCFYLKTQGKDRGYVERQEHTGANGGPLQVTFADLLIAATRDGHFSRSLEGNHHAA